MTNLINFQNKKIHFSKRGKGNTIILLHGFLESLNIWQSFSEELSQHFKVITIDLPGHGNSDNFNDIHTMEFMADCVHSVIAHCGIRECVMIGHSMGGYVTLSFAEKYPEMLRGLGLFNSNANADSPEAKINRSRAIAVIRKSHLGFIRHFIPDLFAPENVSKFEVEIKFLQDEAYKISQQGLIAAMEGMKARKDKTQLLKHFPNPVLFIVGKKDTRSSFEKIMEQISLPIYCDALILGNCGHMGYIEEKQQTLITLENFTRKCFSI